MTQSTSHKLPPLSRKILEGISRGEFCNFDLLLPCTSPLALDEYSIQVNSGAEASLSLVPRHQTRLKVVDFHTWLTAWNLYLQAMAFYHPHLIMPLIHYQSTITKFASQYDFSAWVTYDFSVSDSEQSDVNMG